MSLRMFARVSFNALVIAGLVGIGWWGHRSGWKLPKFSTLNGSATSEKRDWCDAHSVPESICVECNESLLPRPPAYGWCSEHGVHECPLCHPDVAQLRVPYRVTNADLARARRALEIPRPRNSEDCKLHERRIQFASETAAIKAGIGQKDGVRDARKQEIYESLSVFGEIVNDPARVAHLSTRAPGSVAKVFKHLGDSVEEGEVLALVEAGEVGKAKSQFGHACLLLEVKRQERDRLTEASSLAARAAADTAIREAKLQFLSARQALINLGVPQSPADFQLLSESGVAGKSEADLADRLHFLGIPDSIRGSLSRETHSNNLLPLRSPGKGQIVSRDISVGEVVDPNRPVIEIVNTSRVWLTLDVRAEDAGAVIPGKTQVRRFQVEGRRDPLEGTIAWISSQADPVTRTVKARVELDNDGTLRAHTFGKGELVLRHEKEAIVVPSASVHWEGDCHVVFVRDKDWSKPGAYKIFHTRVVRIGKRDDFETEIIAGVLPGELVAVKGSEVLRAELLKGNLGEG